MTEELKKFTKTHDIQDFEILTDTGFEDIQKLHETIEYDVYELKTKTGKILKCADNHKVFMKVKANTPGEQGSKNMMIEVFVKDLKPNDMISVDGALEFDLVDSITNLGYKEKMFDFELGDETNHRYFTNDILSHNTETAKVIAEEIFGPNSLIRIDMSEYTEKINVSRLTGAAPGYVGYEEGGQLTEQVRRKPFSVILFDEIEKAHPEVFNVLLQVLDEGRLTDNSGRLVNFRNTIIIMTSNVGVKLAQGLGVGIGFGDKSDFQKELKMKENIEKEMKKKFAPEFINRINNIVTFNQLTKENIGEIVKIHLDKLKARIEDSGFILSWSSKVISIIVDETYEPQYGARPVERGIQNLIEDMISEEILIQNPPVGSELKLKAEKGTIKVDIKFPHDDDDADDSVKMLK